MPRLHPLTLRKGVKSQWQRQRVGTGTRCAAHVSAVIQEENGPYLLQLSPLGEHTTAD